MLEKILKSLSANQCLSEKESYEFGNLLLKGYFDENIAREILIKLHEYGETKEAVLGMVKSMREHALLVQTEGIVVDTCGTGGSGISRFNTSTLVAFVLASLGVKVAKHGNRSTQGRCGSFDLLEAIGIDIEKTKEQVEKDIQEKNLGFIYARTFHPSMKHVVSIRKSISHKTIFNLIGPLSNPANITHHLLGVSDKKLMDLMAYCMRELGISGMVVCGNDGLDDITIQDATTVLEVAKDGISKFEITPEDFDITRKLFSDIKCGDTESNKDIFYKLLEGKNIDMELQPIFDHVCLNSVAVLKMVGKVEDIKQGVEMVREAFVAGNVKSFFEKL